MGLFARWPFTMAAPGLLFFRHLLAPWVGAATAEQAFPSPGCCRV